MKSYTKCPKCKKKLTLIGEQRGFYQLARCKCDYQEPGTQESKSWHGVHVLAIGSIKADKKTD